MTPSKPDGEEQDRTAADDLTEIIALIDNALEQASRLTSAWFAESDVIGDEERNRRRGNLATHMWGSYGTAFRYCLGALRKLPPGTYEPRERSPREHPDPVGDVANALQELRDWAKDTKRSVVDVGNEAARGAASGKRSALLEPTVIMIRGAERVQFGLDDIELRRRGGWSVDDPTYVALATRVEESQPSFQECDQRCRAPGFLDTEVTCCGSMRLSLSRSDRTPRRHASASGNGRWMTGPARRTIAGKPSRGRQAVRCHGRACPPSGLRSRVEWLACGEQGP